jgi:hypothetical protein
MNPFARYPRRAAGAALGALLLATACTDRSPVSPDPEPGETPAGTPGKPVYLTAVTCTVDLAAETTTCDPVDPAGSAGGAPRTLVLGGQGRYVSLETGPMMQNGAAGTISMDVSVRNLIPQALGTTNGTALDPAGVRVFLQSGPYARTGSGSVSIMADGVGTFTASAQPYFQYNSVLDPYETSGARTWTFQVDPGVTSFGFSAFVAAAVQYPDGWVDISPKTAVMPPNEQWKLIANSVDAAGNLIPNTFFTWTSTDTTVATVSDGLVSTVRAGTIPITVTSGARQGSTTLTVTGMRRVWEGDVDTNYFTRGNWPFDVVPGPSDTIVIPNPSPNYPLLTANAQVSGIEIAEGAVLNLAAYDMTASRNVASSTAGGTGIVSTTGRLFLSGTAATVRGRVPRLRVTGTYSLAANLSIVAPLQVDAGRLTSTGFRIESNNNQ